MGSSGPASAFESETFGQDASFRLEQPVGSMSISPCGRDVVLASRDGLHIIDLDSPFSPPRYLPHHTPWEVADVQWSPFAARDYWVVSTSNQKALVWNLGARVWQDAIEFVLHGHRRAITDINFSAHHPDVLATCAVDSFVHCWDLRSPFRPVISFSDWFAGATQVKWSRQDSHVVASSHDKYLRIWDDRMGAYPVRSIEAHCTKIYGLDWNRFHPNKIATCSLDKTIKLWDCNNPEDHPEAVIETPFPVWRARHTPFGFGLLAMPQRGNSDLHLYDRRPLEDKSVEKPVLPVATFQGHKGQVKEFLWRPRGTIAGGIDYREFQLVTWGTDRELRLHRVGDETLLEVGYQRGVNETQKLNFTRKGAKYKTFRDEPGEPMSPVSQFSHGESPSVTSQSLQLRPRGSTSVGMRKVSIPQFRGWIQGAGSGMRIGMAGKSSVRQEMNPIAWMKNVRIAWDQDTLAEEITQVGEKFPKVKFETVDMQQRRATISMHGPWADQNAPIYMRIDMRFPKSYPREANAVFHIQKTSSMASSLVEQLSKESQKIAETYCARKKGCLEAVVRYFLREESMEQIVSWVQDEPLAGSKLLNDPDIPDDASSDDDDDQIDVPPDLLNSSSANVRVPLAKACGALWSDNGLLVCFFPPKVKEPPSLFDLLGASALEEPRSVRIFEGFGRLKTSFPRPKATTVTKTADGDDAASDSSDGSLTSSSSSSASSDTAAAATGGALQNRPWYSSILGLQQRSRSVELSNRSTDGLGQIRSRDPARLNFVSIRTYEDLIPSKSYLARGYKIFGNGPDVCEHNALVASQHSSEVIASVWRLAQSILRNDIPLECFEDPIDGKNIITIAQSASRYLKRKDSGIDLSYDKDTAKRHKIDAPGRIRWGGSSFGPGYLVPALFEYFENLGDVQMLAMLSCVFAEPKASQPEQLLISHTNKDLSMQFKAPAFCIDYHPSPEIADSITRPVPATTFKFSNRTPNRTTAATAAQESSSSDTAPSYEINGPRVSMAAETSSVYPSAIHIFDPRRTSGVSNTTTAKELRDGEVSSVASAAVSVSTSPEEHRLSGRSATNLAFSFSRASLTALAQTYSNSPPTGSTVGGFPSSSKKYSPSGSLTPGAWNAVGIFAGSGSGRGSRASQHSSGAASDEYRTNTLYSVPSLASIPSSRQVESDVSGNSRSSARTISKITGPDNSSKLKKPNGRAKVKIKVALRNQNKFDNDGYAAVPLLNPKLEWKFRAYRASYAHLLSVWELYPQMAEVLKFDGLPGYYFPPSSSLSSSSSSSKVNSSDMDISKQSEELTLGYARKHKTMAEATKAEILAKRGLEVRRCCRDCGQKLAAVEKNGVPIGWHCTRPECPSTARKKSLRATCVVCDKAAVGLVLPCLSCGHVSCYECGEGWFGLNLNRRPSGSISSKSGGNIEDEDYPNDDLEDRDERLSCPSGCGCLCASQNTIISVPYPPEPEPEPQQEERPGRQKSHASTVRSELTMAELGPDTAMGALFSITSRTTSASAAKESMMLLSRERSTVDESAVAVSATSAVARGGIHDDSITASRYDSSGGGGGGGGEGDGDGSGNTDADDGWTSSKYASLGRGIGGGLSRGLSTKSSDATIRKSGR